MEHPVYILQAIALFEYIMGKKYRFMKKLVGHQTKIFRAEFSNVDVQNWRAHILIIFV